MQSLARSFLKNFIIKEKGKIIWFSLWRMFSFLQVLFWPFAFAKILDILSQDISNWKASLPWLIAMVINKLTEDFVRLRAKHGIEVITSGMRISMATFFAEETQIKDGVKTGEAVQKIKSAGDTLKEAALYYKNQLLGIPVSLIFVPIILYNADRMYLVIFGIYVLLYLIIDKFATAFYLEEAREYFSASEIFWGTVYRKTPDVWRGREEIGSFKKKVDEQSEVLKKEIETMDSADTWRWIALQSLSSTALGFGIVFVFLRIARGESEVGDLVLITSYLGDAQETLNRITSSSTRIVNLKMALHRLSEVVERK